ncbi:unnamed protein product, partial [Musa acuminata var. zebrina]
PACPEEAWATKRPVSKGARMWFGKLCHSWKLPRMHVFSQQLERLMGYLFFIWTMLEEVYPMSGLEGLQWPRDTMGGMIAVG